MNIYITLFVFIFYVSKPATGFRDSNNVGTINQLLDGLALENWDAEESSCRHDTELILNGVKNNTLWATWVWDSMQLPVGTFYGSLYHLGNYDQCLNMPWPSDQRVRNQYCLVDVKLTDLNKYDEDNFDPYDDTEKYFGANFRYGMRINTIFLGVCLPVSCKPESVAKISRHIFSLSHLPFKDINVNPRDCQVTRSVSKPMGYYMFWFIIFSMASLSVLVYFFGNSLDTSDSISSKLTRCFCFTRNMNALTDVSMYEIKSISSIRFLTYAIIVIIHLVYMSQSVYINQIDAEKEMTSSPFTKMSFHLDLCVDTFFVMSGLLHFRGLLSSRKYQPFKTILKRYLRFLLPLYLLSLIFLTYVLPYIASGPVWPRFVRQHSEPCAESWWGNLLMTSSKCSVTAWYIHCDFQLTILGTLIFMVYNKNKRAGFIFFSLAYVISVVLPALWNYLQQLPGILWYDYKECLDLNTNKVYQTVYMPFYTRASSYLVGVAMAYLMTVFKPQNYRRTIPKSVSISTFILSMMVLVLCLQIGNKMFKKEFGAVAMAIIPAIDRTIWAIAICSIITACEYGTLPIISDFLGSKVFVPLSRLTYSGYLSHTVFIYMEVYSLRALLKYDTLGMFIHGLGLVAIVGMVCFLIWLFIEAPTMNIINLLFDFNRSEIHEIESSEANLCKGTIKNRESIIKND